MGLSDRNKFDDIFSSVDAIHHGQTDSQADTGIAILPVYLTPPLNWVSARGQKKLEWCGYQMVEKVLR